MNSENEVKNRFNSTIRKRKLAESNGKTGFVGPSYTSDEDQDNRIDDDVQQRYQCNAESSVPLRYMSKKMRHNPEVSRSVPKYPGRSYPSIPQGYSIISLSRDDMNALHIAERLLKRLFITETSFTPQGVSQLMSILSMTHFNDMASTFASLNMVPITNIADHEPHTPSSGITSMVSSENEGPESDHPDQLRVDTGRSVGSYDQSVFHRLKNKKMGTIQRRVSSDKSLWAPAEDQSEPHRFTPPPSAAATTGIPSSSPSLSSPGSFPSQDPSYQKMPFYPSMPPRGRSPYREGNIKQVNNLSASLPVYEDDSRNCSQWQKQEQGNCGKSDGNERDSDGDGEGDGDGDGDADGVGRDKSESENKDFVHPYSQLSDAAYYNPPCAMTERSVDTQCSSPFSLFEELTCSSPSWDCFSPAYTPNMTALPSATHSPNAQETGQMEGRGPHKKRKLLPLNDPPTPKLAKSTASVTTDQLKTKNFSRSESSSVTNEKGSLEDDIVVEALRMLSGSSRSRNKGHRSGASSVSGGYNFFHPSDGCDTDYMSTFSLSDTPMSSRPQSPTRLVLDDPSLVLPGQMDGLKMNSSYFSLSTTPWSSRPESPEDNRSQILPENMNSLKMCYEMSHADSTDKISSYY
jgi:hypothetical protein